MRRVAKKLFPGYFALVMATGIMAMGCYRLGYLAPAKPLYYLAFLSYGVLLLFTLVRAICFPKEMLADFANFSRGPAFFTIVAASGVLGTCCLRIGEAAPLAWTLWLTAIALWVLLVYSFAIALITAQAKPPVASTINGAWLIIVVGAQSVAALGSMLTEYSSAPDVVMLVSAAFFMFGCGLYLLLISLLVSRLIFMPIRAADLDATHWVMMGAAAISTLAGAELDRHSASWAFQVQALPVLQGFTFFFWIAATGWIPLLVILGIWRHVRCRHPLAYEPQLWSVVFPLGMYTVSTHALGQVFSLDFLIWVPRVMLPIALVAWAAVLVGFLKSSTGVRRAKRPAFT